MSNENLPPIDAKTAVKNAIDFYNQVSGEKYHLSIEEVVFSEKDLFWHIVIGFSDLSENPKLEKNIKFYKEFKVSPNNGMVEYMKIYKV